MLWGGVEPLSHPSCSRTLSVCAPRAGCSGRRPARASRLICSAEQRQSSTRRSELGRRFPPESYERGPRRRSEAGAYDDDDDVDAAEGDEGGAPLRGGGSGGAGGGGGGGGWPGSTGPPQPSLSNALLAGVFVLGIGAGVAFDNTLSFDRDNVASIEMVDRLSPNNQACAAYGSSAIVYDQRVFMSFNPCVPRLGFVRARLHAHPPLRRRRDAQQPWPGVPNPQRAARLPKP